MAHPRYFRTTLTLPEGLQPHDVIMGRMQVDDGAAVYLNGREVYRCYLPAGPGTPLYFELKPKGKAGAPRDMECVSRALYCMHACTHCAVGRERRIAIARFELHRGRTACCHFVTTNSLVTVSALTGTTTSSQFPPVHWPLVPLLPTCWPWKCTTETAAICDLTWCWVWSEGVLVQQVQHHRPPYPVPAPRPCALDWR